MRTAFISLSFLLAGSLMVPAIAHTPASKKKVATTTQKGKILPMKEYIDQLMAKAAGIEFRIDTRNARSMAAVAKLGGLREGVLRQERITWNGHLRDTALYAILAHEWRENAGFRDGSAPNG